MSIRTTVTLDDDVLYRLQEASRKTGVSVRKLLNDAVRRGMSERSRPESSPLAELPSYDLGVARYSYDNVHEVLDILEGEDRRF